MIEPMIRASILPLKVLQGVQVRDVTVRSIDRVEYFRPSATY
jgi:hypothetical protein